MLKLERLVGVGWYIEMRNGGGSGNGSLEGEVTHGTCGAFAGEMKLTPAALQRFWQID